MPTKPLTIVFFSANGSGLVNFHRAFQRLKNKGTKLAVLSRSAEDLKEDTAKEAFLTELRQKTPLVILIRFHGGKTSCPCFDELVAAAEHATIYVDAKSEADLELIRTYDLDSGQPQYGEIVEYMHHDGESNWYNMLKRLLGLPADRPCTQPLEGLYHPRWGVVSDIETYLEQQGYAIQTIESGRQPVIGIWFFPVRWIDADMSHIDALIMEIERQGGVPICCFYKRNAGPNQKAKKTRWIRDHFFRYRGRTLIDVLINLMHFSLSLLRPEEAHLMGELDIPILHAMELYADKETWAGTDQGVSPLDVCVSFAQPEFDGYLLSVPVATRERQAQNAFSSAVVPRLEPIPDRIVKVVRMAMNWAVLKTKPNDQKKIAIVFHNYPPRNDTIGTAIGLDTFESVHQLLLRLADEGYILKKKYSNASALADHLISGLTCDRRWLTPEAMARKAVSQIEPDQYDVWHALLPQKNQVQMACDWGPSPGALFVHDDTVMVNGVLNGNIYLGVQPPRGHIEQKDRIHDPDLSPSYHYLYFYRWLRDIFKADAVIHMGTHGSLEWLPGKSAGLSNECYPDLAIGEIPNIYPYIINIPSEGTQTKRRSFACLIDHMIPVMSYAGLYEDLAELDQKLIVYMQTRDMNPTALPVIRREIWDIIEKTNLFEDLMIDKATAFHDFDDFVLKIQDYLTELAESAIVNGLHVLGRPPGKEGLAELVTQIVRVRNGHIPSLREAVADKLGYDLDTLLASKGHPDPTGQYTTNTQALAAIRTTCLDIVSRCILNDGVVHHCQSPEIDQVRSFIRESVVPKIKATRNEMTALIGALAGRFVPPGGSGNPTRGQIEILPSGRNFYSVDPLKIPTSTAWQVGIAMAEKLLERYTADTGELLETMGMVLWGSNEFRNYGEDIAQALYLMGVKPVWEPNGRIAGLETIPASTLKHPRVDITFRISGFFRDGLPNIVELMDDAVMMVAALKEPYEINALRRNVLQEKEILIKKGISSEDAFREACFRLYSCPPGTYGAGVCDAIHAQVWETSDDLGDVFVNWGGYAYGKGVYGKDKRKNFRRRLSKMQVVVKNEDNRELDLFSSDDFNSFFGGYIAAVKKESGRQPHSYAGDSSDPDRVVCRSVAEEVRHIFRSRLLNPKWIGSMRNHDFKGAGDLSATVDFAFAWDATSQVIDNWMYAAVAEKYAFDPEIQAWFQKVNPHALQNITERLLEAIRRGMWQADTPTQDKLESLYLKVEGDIEAFTDEPNDSL